MRYAYFMTTFLRALKEKPTTNREPAEAWKPMLTDEGVTALRCSTCQTDPKWVTNGPKMGCKVVTVLRETL